MKIARYACIALTLLVVAGCATPKRSVFLHWRTIPLGAVVRNDVSGESGTTDGYSLRVKLSREEIENRAVIAPAVTARWRSGATSSEKSRPVRLQRRQQVYNFWIQHPSSAGKQYEYDANSARYNVTFVSDPEFAEASVDGESWKETPVSLGRDISYEEFEQGSVVFPQITFRWKSGATNSIRPTVTLGKEHELTVKVRRPDGVHGLDADELYGAERLWKTLCGDSTLKIIVALDSDPAGASIYTGDKKIGRCPLVVPVEVAFEDFYRGSVGLAECTARWPSGATNTATPSFDLRSGDSLRRFVFRRPANCPDVQVDVSNALELGKMELELEKIRILREQADEASRRDERHLELQEASLRVQRDALTEQRAGNVMQQFLKMQEIQGQREAAARVYQMMRDAQPQMRRGRGEIRGAGLERYEFTWTEQ